jgi:prephenate dehydratase
MALSPELDGRPWNPEPWERQIAGCRRIVTLGNATNPVTCSMDAALALYPDMDHHGSKSFESAYERTLTHEHDAFLVPTAYPKINAFLMDDRISILDVNVREIPPLVLCTGATAELGEQLRKLFAHPATIPLRSRIAFAIDETVLCDSNEAAAEAALADHEQTVAISNQLAANMMGLRILRVLRRSAPMGWLLLGRRDRDR